jgi:hypothetical protein
MLGERLSLREIGHLDIPEASGMLQLAMRRGVLYVGTTEPGWGTAVIDVRDPRKPHLIERLPGVEAAISPKVQTGDDLLLVNYERRGKDEPPMRGLGIYDISEPAQPKRIGSLPMDGKGVHRMWYAGGRYAYVSAQATGYRGQIMLIVDLSDPGRPQIAGRWAVPGSAEGEEPISPPGQLYQTHHPTVWNERAYIGCWDWGAAIVDVSNVASPALVGHAGPWITDDEGGASHTALCLPERGLMVVTDEALLSNPKPKHVRIFDISDETQPRELARFPSPEGDHAARGRFGPHNLHENQPGAFRSDRYIMVSYFNAGLRLYDIADPAHPREVASLEPDPPPGQPQPIVNDLYVDADGIVFASDRAYGRMYVAELR